MAAAFQGGEVVLTGTTPVTVVAAPGSGEQKEVLGLHVWNRDTADRTITAKKLGGTITVELGKITVVAGLHGLMPMGVCVLDGIGESITVQSDATAATTEPVVDVSVFKIP